MLSIKTRQIRALSLFFLPLLVGCAVGPNYRPVQAQVPDAWPSIARQYAEPASPAQSANPADSGHPANVQQPATVQPPSSVQPTASGQSPASEQPSSVLSSQPLAVTPQPVSVNLPVAPSENLAKWWTVFNDPVLTKLIDDGMAENLDLKQARLRILQARAARGVIVSGLFPQVDGVASVETNRTPVANKGGFIGRISNSFMHGLDASWELDFFGGTRRAVEGADAAIDAAIEDRRNVMVTLDGEIGVNYTSLRQFQKQLAIARDNVASQQKSVDLTERKFKGGISNALDVANARALVASTRAQIPVLETAMQQQIYSLSVLLGREPNALDQELNIAGPIPAPPPEIPIGLPSDLLLRRPDIRSAQAQVHAANAQIGVAVADLFPKFALTGSAGFQGAKQSALVNWASRFYTYGANIDWSIFSAGKVQSNIKLQRILTEQAEVTFHQTVLTALQDVDNAAFAYAKEKEHHDTLAEEVKAYEQVVTLSIRLYADGNSDFLNVIVAQRSLYQAQDALVQSEGALSIDVVAIYKALGGGWNAPAISECTAPVVVKDRN